METLFLPLVAIVALVIWSIQTYNKLQKYKQGIIEQSSNMQVSMQMRRDLASRILDIAQGFGDHEKLTHLKISANQQVSTERLAALSQSFPELKANNTYLQLMKQLEDLESNIADKREAYNKSVKVYNSFRASFPAMLVANKLKFEAAPYYDADDQDTLDNLATFMRDDAKAVQALFNDSSEAVKKSASELKDSAATKIDAAIKSELVQSAVVHGDAAIGKAVAKAKEQTQKFSQGANDQPNNDDKAEDHTADSKADNSEHKSNTP